MTFTDAEAEAIRVYHAMFYYASNQSTADLFGCSKRTVQSIVAGKWHSGPKAKRARPFSTAKRDKIKILAETLRSGPKTSYELAAAVGPRWWFYLSALKANYNIENRRVWVMMK